VARKTKIREIADKATASLRRETYRCLLSLRKLSAADLESDTAIHAQLLKYFLGAGLDTTRSWKELYTRCFRAGANQGLEALRGRAVRKDISTSMTFDAVNPNVVAAIQQNMLSLITSITADTRNAIRFAVTTGAQGQLTVAQQAVAIRPVLGLTAPQARALANYRANLETGNYRQTLQNALRDKRYDARTLRALKEGMRLTRAQIDTMVARYGERLLKHRSEVVARTETLRAANAGQVETWRQAQAQGLLPDSMRMRWLVATDERVCQNCPRIPGMNPADGVPVGQSFQTPYGMVSSPPAHVLCRCAIGLS